MSIVMRDVRQSQRTAVPPAAIEIMTNDQVKQDLRKRLHDQRARLHVLEWQADIQGRRTGRPSS